MQRQFKVNGFVVALSLMLWSAVCGVILTIVTAEWYSAWSQGVEHPGGFTLPVTLVIDGIVMAAWLWGHWLLYEQASVTMDDWGIAQVGLFGIRRYEWQEVRGVYRFNVAFHVKGPKGKIIVTPILFANPDTVIERLDDGLRKSAAWTSEAHPL